MKFIRITDLLFILAVLVGAIWTYQIKHDSEVAARKLSKLRVDIASQENKITLLQADWAIMISPERLENVAESYRKELALEEMTSSQIITLDELPELRPAPPAQEQYQVEDEGIDRKTTTGGIKNLIKQNGDSQ